MVKYKGHNILLEGTKRGLSSVLGKDSKGTDEVNNIIDDCFVAFDGDSNDNDNAIIPRDSKYIVAI